jgi:hypothetical protein
VREKNPNADFIFGSISRGTTTQRHDPGVCTPLFLPAAPASRYLLSRSASCYGCPAGGETVSLSAMRPGTIGPHARGASVFFHRRRGRPHPLGKPGNYVAIRTNFVVRINSPEPYARVRKNSSVTFASR